MDIEDLFEKEKERIAIIDPSKCKPDKCGKECVKICPVNRQGNICVDIVQVTDSNTTKKKKLASIAESLCTGCGMCVKVCPFSAIKIVNVPKGLKRDVVHRYGPNSFKLHKLPNIKTGVVTGILGQNGLGKSTIMDIYSKNITMNLGRFDLNQNKIDSEINRRFRGQSTQNIVCGNISSYLKPQNLGKFRSEKLVSEFLGDRELNDTNLGQSIRILLDRSMKDISGGELQRVVIYHACSQSADLYMFDEPTSFLDLKQRIDASDSIRDLARDKTHVMVVDHDVNILDYVSDNVVILYGERAVYGICATPLSIGHGINSYFEGYLSKDNVRFRRTPFKFEPPERAENILAENPRPMFEYKSMSKTLGDFNLNIESAKYYDHGITILLGENGAGKTTFVNALAEELSKESIAAVKPQHPDEDLRKNKNSSVKDYLGDRIYVEPFRDIVRKLGIDSIEENTVKTLSGGELQKVMILKCIMTNADIYLMDEPSAFLDTETRINISKIIKEYFFEKPASVFVIDHDMLMTTYLGDYAILFTGDVGQSMTAHSPVPMKEGMNSYLKNLGITMRIDQTKRRRLNKLNSAKDRDQKKAGEYY